MLDVVSYSASTQASLVAQGIATDVPHLSRLIEEGIKHQGFSFISVITSCATFNPPGMFDALKKNATYLREGDVVEMPESSGLEPWTHDPGDISRALLLAQNPVLDKPHLGIFFRGVSGVE